MQRPLRTALLLAALVLGLNSPHAAPRTDGDEALAARRREAHADLRRVRLEQGLIRAERTAVLLGELMAVSPEEATP